MSGKISTDNSIELQSFHSLPQLSQMDDSKKDSHPITAVSQGVIGAPEKATHWYPNMVKKLEQWETDLKTVPDLWIQRQIDDKTAWVVNQIKNWFSSQKKTSNITMQSINQWLHNYESSHIWKKIALYIAKLPLSVMRNVLLSFLSTLTAIIYAAVHPLKGILQLMRALVDLLYALEQAESWTKMGVGFIGIGLGQAIIPGSPVALMGLILGTLFCVAGLSMGIFKAINQRAPGQSKKEVILAELWKHIQVMPEAFVTGLLLGMIKWSISTQQVTHAGTTTLQGNTMTRLCWWMVTPSVHTPITQGTLIQAPVSQTP